MHRGLKIVLALALLSAPARARGEALTVCGAHIQVDFEGPTPVLPHQAFLDWVNTSARAVSTYFGRFPVADYRIRVLISGGGGVQGGTTWGFGGAHTDIRVGRNVTASELAQDWVMTHEMVHVAFPNMGDDRAWIHEGVATYVEPLARAFVGIYPLQKVWSDLVEGLPQGLPPGGDPGLDRADSWGRTYWGGALFFTDADVEIRRRTKNQRGLIDALRGILSAGGNNAAEWTPAHVFAVGDAAVGVPVLEELWAQMGPKPGAPNLALLWTRLGVPRTRSGQFDDSAADADIRRAISATPPPATCR